MYLDPIKEETKRLGRVRLSAYAVNQIIRHKPDHLSLTKFTDLVVQHGIQSIKKTGIRVDVVERNISTSDPVTESINSDYWDEELTEEERMRQKAFKESVARFAETGEIEL